MFVILSGVRASRSEVLAQSKDLFELMRRSASQGILFTAAERIPCDAAGLIEMKGVFRLR
jgi:hypothetical protein